MTKDVSDPEGEAILETIKSALHYNRWITNLLHPYLQGRIIEIGSGIGNMTREFIGLNLALTATDYNQTYLGSLKKAFPGLPLFHFDLTASQTPAALRYKFDTAVCLNVLEHIAAENRALTNIAETLAPGGKLLLLVPAFPFAFGRVDKALGHIRRYTKKSLSRSLAKAGFRIETVRYVNFLGLWGWWINSVLWQRSTIYPWQIRLFDLISRPLLYLEKFVRFPLGLSVLAVAVKT